MSDVDFDTRQVSEKEQAEEVISQFASVCDPDCRQVIANHRDDTFRKKQLDRDDARSVVMTLSSAFLIEEVDMIGRPTDWQLSERCKTLLELQDEYSLWISHSTAESILNVSEGFWSLPCHSDGAWRSREIDVDLEGRKLGILSDAGLIDPVHNEPGCATVWQTTKGADVIREMVVKVLQDDE